MRLSTKKFHAFSRFFGSPVVTVGYKANYKNQVRHNTNFLSVVSPYTNRRLCDKCTNHASIWTFKTQNIGQLEES